MSRILVTGASGFIGRYVVQELLNRSEEVIATSSRRERAAAFSWFDKVSFVPFDFKELDLKRNYFEFFGAPTHVIHLAWQGLPNYRSLSHFEDNVAAHYHFVKNLIRNGCRDVTVTGTCFEYGMKEGALVETMPSDPQNPYALAKDTLRKYLESLQKVEGFPFKWIRLFYMYGAGQNSSSLFSQLEDAIQSGLPEFNMSKGEQVRDYLPVESVASSIVSIALQNKIQGIINCCSGNPVTVKKMVEDYKTNKGSNIKLNLGFYPYPDFEPMAFWGDNSKLQSILNEQ